MAPQTTAAMLQGVLADALASSDLAIVGESVGSGGLAGSTKGLQATYPDRVLDLPVADRATVGFAVGMALAGRTTVVELTGTGRLPAVLEVLAEAASVAAQGEFQVPLVVRVPYGSEAGDRIDRPVADLVASVPGLSVRVGSSPAQVVGLLRQALSSTTPVVLLEPRQLYTRRSAEAELQPTAHVVRAGEHVTILAWGAGVHDAELAAEALATEQISAQVVDLVNLAPLDADAIGALVRGTGRLVAAHDHERGFAERLLRVGLHQAFLYLESPPAAADMKALKQAARDAVFY